MCVSTGAHMHVICAPPFTETVSHALTQVSHLAEEMAQLVGYCMWQTQVRAPILQSSEQSQE